MSILYAHAQKIVNEDKKKIGLFLGTGSTKTRIALFLARGTTLVICPKTQKEDRNWEREIQKIQKEMPTFTCDMTVVSNEEFKKLCKIGFVKPFKTVIVDEAHKMLGATPSIRYVKRQPIPKCSQMFDELNKYLFITKPERLYLVTATPTRSPMCIWAAAKLLGYNWNFYEFRDAFYIKLPMPGREVWSPRKDNETKERLAKAVQSLGYTGQLSDYFDVPDQTYKTIYLELTQKQLQRIKEIKLEFPDPLVQVGKRHQIENGVLSGDEFNRAEIIDNEKIDKICELAIEFPKMIIFVKYTAQIIGLSMALLEMGKRIFVLDGNTKYRGEAIANVNAISECILIVQAQISSGWEIPDCPVMVFASMSYSVVDRIQGEGRILRANKLKKNLYIDLVVRGGVDEAVKKAIDNKVDFHEKIYADL